VSEAPHTLSSPQAPTQHREPEIVERRNSADRVTFANALAVCRRALDDVLEPLDGQGARAASVSFSAQVSDAVRDLARDARGRNIPPERLIALFKSVIKSLPAIERHDPETRNEVARRLVQVAIEAYYSPDAAPPSV
jgi:hypothetical protein